MTDLFHDRIVVDFYTRERYCIVSYDGEAAEAALSFLAYCDRLAAVPETFDVKIYHTGRFRLHGYGDNFKPLLAFLSYHKRLQNAIKEFRHA